MKKLNILLILVFLIPVSFVSGQDIISAQELAKIIKKDKTYYKINDYNKLRDLFGVLLAEVQRIKSEGDYEAGKNLVETYGVIVEPELHAEVKDRFAKLNIAPYGGFINPVFKVIEQNGEITDIQVEYPEDYAEQMLYYSENYSYLNGSR